MNNLRVNMGKRMKEKRKALHLTQEYMAELLGISVKHYGGVERGAAGLSLENLIEVSNILDIGLDYLIKGEEMPDDYIPSKIRNFYLNCPKDKQQYIVDLFEIISKF